MNKDNLQSPFPYFGGKSQIADEVWERLGDVDSYIEPFAGSSAVLLRRPAWHKGDCETINDKDGFVSNFWRAVKHDPQQVAEFADWPVLENDLHARHAWLVGQKESLQARLEGDPDWFDAKIAGWWVWGICCWIGGGFCSGQGPWQVLDGELKKLEGKGTGVKRKKVHLVNKGRGVNRKRVHLRDNGMGVNRKLVHLSGMGMGVTRSSANLLEWMEARAKVQTALDRACLAFQEINNLELDNPGITAQAIADRLDITQEKVEMLYRLIGQFRANLQTRRVKALC